MLKLNRTSIRPFGKFSMATAIAALLLAGCSGGAGGGNSGSTALIPQATGIAANSSSTQGTIRSAQSVSQAHNPPNQIGWAHFGTLQSANSARTLLSASNAPLYGAVVQTDTCALIDAGGNQECTPTPDAINNLKFYGLNSIHIYAEDAQEQSINSIGVNAKYIDQIVDEAAQNGMYVIITPSNAHAPCTFDAAFVQSFWQFYASRYANAQNVIFEIMNEPQDSRKGPSAPNTSVTYAPGVLQMEANAYQTIRTYAPNTPVLFFSYPFLLSKASVDHDVSGLTSLLHTNSLPGNTGIAFHGYGDPSIINPASYAVQGEGIALVDTEFHSGTASSNTVTQNVDETNDHLQHSISWMTFLTIKPSNFSIQTQDNYEDLLRAQNVSWPTSYYGVSFPFIVPNFAFNQPQITNGSFAYAPTTAQWTPAGSGAALGWSFSGGGGISSATGSGFTGTNPAPPAGITDVAFIQNQGAMWQTFTNKSLAPNHSYTLGFWQAGRNFNGQLDSNPVTVSVDGHTIGSFTPASTSYAPQYFAFTTNSDSLHTLTFNGQNTQGDRTTFIASVSIH